MNQTQQPSGLVNILFWYEGETQNHSNNKEAYTDGSKSIGRKVSFAEVFTDIIRRGALPIENHSILNQIYITY